MDVVNAFNSVPWPSIIEALRDKGVPGYLVALISDYLSERYLLFGDKNDEIVEYRMTRGVPQGSVLGPILWNVAYDRVLNIELQDGYLVIGYADDILVVVDGRSVEDAVARAEACVDLVINEIKRPRLKVSPAKTEVAVFFNRIAPTMLPSIAVDNTMIGVSTQIRYFGLILDSR